MTEQTDKIEEIAIIGMAGRFPGAKNTIQFWENLANGIESISRFSDDELLARGVSPEKLSNSKYVKAGTVIDDTDLFDASFFGYSPREAEIMDPQQRIFLEIAWESLESAGYDPDSYDGVIGVFAGTSENDYRKNIDSVDPFELMMGNEPDFLTTRISYKLNLKGPSFTIQTACSTSLVAVHQACQNLLTYQCDMALAGGVCIKFPQGQGYLYQQGMIWSPDGHCRPFDAQAQGTIFGQGTGMVVLKRLSEAIEDNDTILAVIKGSAINNDGSMKVGFTAPSVEGQAEAIATALAVADIKADTISYVETHGTATPLGDPIEIEALTQAFREYTSKTEFCAIGSVKSNIGHLDAAAGITGLIKTVLALQHKQIPATLHFRTPNPNIDFSNSPFYVNNTLQEWKSQEHPRRAGVSSFGIGGTNAHVVLEEAPATKAKKPSDSWHLLPISAKTETALQTQIENLAIHAKNCPDISLADIAYTLQFGRKHFNHRKTFVCKELQNIATDIPASATASVNQDIIFMFSGQDSQYVNMCRDLYQEYPFFKETVDLCSEILQTHLNLDLRDILYPSETKIKEATQQIIQTSITQPAIFTIEYSLAKLWNHFGISPSALVGHSIGEYAAACIAGVFSLEDALKLVAARGRLMQSLPPGTMLAIPLSEKDVQPYLSPKISLAVLNNEAMSVVSGETDQINNLVQILSQKGIEGRILHTSHAFHSPMMDPILEEFKKEVEKTNRNTPQIPFVSNVTGTWITETQAKDPSYWAKHLRQTVHFFSCAEELLNHYPKGLFLEVGPGQTLTILTKQHPSLAPKHKIFASTRRALQRENDVQMILKTLGNIWQNGSVINWHNSNKGTKKQRIPLPTYPFERKRYWLQTVESHNYMDQHIQTSNRPTNVISGQSRMNSLDQTIKSPKTSLTEIEIKIANIWVSIIPGINTLSSKDDFYDLGGDSLQLVQIITQIEKDLNVCIPVSSLQQNPILGDFANIIENVLLNKPVCNSNDKINSQNSSKKNSLKMSKRTFLEKIVKTLTSPVKNLPLFLAILRGSFYIVWFRLFRKNVKILFPFLAFTKVDIKGPGKVSIGRWCEAYINGFEHVTILTMNKSSKVVIGNKCSLAGSTIRSKKKIYIEDRVIAARCLIQDFFLCSESPPADLVDKLHQNCSPIKIGSDVWLAIQSAVLAGGNIGKGTVMAAQAILYKNDIKDNSIGSGNAVERQKPTYKPQTK